MSKISTLPWPFTVDERAFRYSVNVEPAKTTTQTAAGQWGSNIFDIDEDYPMLMELRRDILRRDPGRLQVLPHMEPACWDYLLFAMRQLSAEYPALMRLSEEGNMMHWRNSLLDIDQEFEFGNSASLPEQPLAYIGCQVPDDVLLVSERDQQMFLDAGIVTFANAWSVSFDAGMNIREIHGPVPRFTHNGLSDRVHQFMKALKQGTIYRRVNWTFAGTRQQIWDASLEALPEWVTDLDSAISEEDWGSILLRLELEHFIRLPLTGALVFSIRTYMVPLREIATVPSWRDQLVEIVTEIPHDLAEYKGFADYRGQAMQWLAQQNPTPVFT